MSHRKDCYLHWIMDAEDIQIFSQADIRLALSQCKGHDAGHLIKEVLKNPAFKADEVNADTRLQRLQAYIDSGDIENLILLACTLRAMANKFWNCSSARRPEEKILR